MHSWTERIKMRSEKDWEEEVGSKCYKLAKNGNGVERYVRSVQVRKV